VVSHLTESVVFDMDGVLIDSEHVMRRAFAAAHAEIVGPDEAPTAAFLSLMGLSLQEIMRRLGLPPAMEPAYSRHADAAMGEILLFPGAKDVLLELRSRGIRLAIATGKSTSRASAILEMFDVLHLFGAVVGSDQVTRGKPAGDILLEALRQVGGTPSRAIFVGDAVADLQCGRAAGVFTIAATWGQTATEVLLAEQPDAIAGSLAALLDVMAAEIMAERVPSTLQAEADLRVGATAYAHPRDLVGLK
jgi:3-amino-5-hydroxybenzoic acid synthesis related protein